MRVFHAERKRIPKTEDSLAERGEFELPVPICEQSDDSIRLSFATSRRTAKRCRPCSAFLVRFGVAGSKRSNLACPFIGSLLLHQSRCRSSRRGENLLRMLPTDCSEIGTGSSNSPRSATHIWTPPCQGLNCRRDLEHGCSHISGLLVGRQMKPWP
jgi:hypothetical protein